MQYSTTFPTNENPLSEGGGRWILGGDTGLDWTNVKVVSNIAEGTQTGAVPPPYDDSLAVLTGTWGPDQTVETIWERATTVGTANQEGEILLRFNITPHSATGYEVQYETGGGVNIVRWDGALNNFTIIATGTTSNATLDGFSFKATIQGSTINAYVNGKLITTATDTTYTSGNPGFGLYYKSGGGSTQDFGLRYFAALDSVTTHPTLVQQTYSDSSATSASLAKTVTALTLGTLVVVQVATVGGGNVVSVQDNSAGGSNVYTFATSSRAVFDSNINLETWYCLKTTKSGATSITVTWTSSNSYRLVSVWEVSGYTAALFDAAAIVSNGVGSGTTANGPTFNTGYQGEFIPALCTPANIVVNDGLSNPKTYVRFMYSGLVTGEIPALTNGSATCAANPVLSGSQQPVWILGTSGDHFGVTMAGFAETPVTTAPSEVMDDGYIPPIGGGWDTIVPVW